ncbi:MAG: hypothetical protein GY784_06765, partial [Gammaproteobacteria bacterium]|nr:hypothetical protein [Gammaproteobacteria bacterium]
LLIAPPHAIDLTQSESANQGELAKQPLFIVLLTELLIRMALLLIIAVLSESLLSNTVYSTYMLDTVFTIFAGLGVCHSFAYFLLLGYLRTYIGSRPAMKLYRLLRNLCYAPIPGLLAVMPLLLWKWELEQMPFDDGLVFQVYYLTTLLMIAAGLVEALVMKRKPLGLDKHLSME